MVLATGAMNRVQANILVLLVFCWSDRLEENYLKNEKQKRVVQGEADLLLSLFALAIHGSQWQKKT